MATLNVGFGQAYTTLAAAVAASHDGDVIAVQAGTYVNDFATVHTKVTIVGVGGMANFVATVSPPNGKAILVTQTDVTIQNLSFSGAAVPDMNGAGIRYEGGNLAIINSYFHDNQDGILANADPNGTIRITGSEFAHNGAGDGYSHNIYVNAVKALNIDDSYFHDAIVGHEIKSRALSTTITNSRIFDGTGTASYSIDLPNGGVAVIKNNFIQQGVNSDNPIIIDYGEEGGVYSGSSLLIDGNTVVNDQTAHVPRMLNNATAVTATISGNDVYGLTSGQIASGPASISGTLYLSTHPSLDTSEPWLNDTIFGTAGADTLMGTAGADTLVGYGGDDWLRGYGGDDWLRGNGGDDRLIGGAGNDLLGGGAGRDIFKGGGGKDHFDFNDIAETGLTSTTRDTIVDFTQGSDKIDLATIDANALLGGNQAFAFIAAAAFHGVAGELRATASASSTHVWGDVNGELGSRLLDQALRRLHLDIRRLRTVTRPAAPTGVVSFN